jgi:hypothetical protein
MPKQGDAMNRHIILSLLSTTAANWFGGTQPEPAGAEGGLLPNAVSPALRRAMDALERRQAPRRARLPGGRPFSAMPVPAALRGALA